MAQYRQLMIEGKDGFYLMNPSNFFEACRIAWMLWRHPEKISALVGVDKEWMIANCTHNAAVVRQARSDCPN